MPRCLSTPKNTLHALHVNPKKCTSAQFGNDDPKHSKANVRDSMLILRGSRYVEAGVSGGDTKDHILLLELF